MTERINPNDINQLDDWSDVSAIDQAEQLLFNPVPDTPYDRWIAAKRASRQHNPPPASSAEHNYSGSNRHVIIDPVTGAWLRDK